MKLIKKLTFVTLSALAISSVASCSSNSNTTNVNKSEDSDSSSKLRVSLTDGTLDSASQQNMIKAEYLIKNDGYKDSDEISVIVTMSNSSMLELYKQMGSGYDSVSDFYNSNIGSIKNQTIINDQNRLIEKLKSHNLISEVTQTYTTILNGFAVTTTYGKLEELSNFANVDNTIICDTYNLPTTTSTTTSSTNAQVRNNVDVYDTGIFNSSDSGYDGNGTSVAVLDSGFDCSHSVFANQPTKEMYTLADIDSKLTQLNAYKTTDNLKAEDVYYSKKIPYAYDYADKDYDVNPTDSSHGTHVAGIIGGQDDTITGVAVNTQLLFMKVFGDTSSGAETEDILAAVNDAVILGVDCINMSLGTSCGFNREADNDAINEAYDAVEDAGIALIAAASNDYSAGFGGPDGNTNKVTNIDSGTLGSPASYTSSLAVASISGTLSSYIVTNHGTANEDSFFFLQSRTITSKANDFIAELTANDSDYATNKTKTYQYVCVPGTGSRASYNSINVEGKIAVISRGDNSFDDKVKIAKQKGAIAAIIYNNVEGEIAMTISLASHIPAISITKEDGLKLTKQSTGTITIAESYTAGPFMSDFSSWGPTPSLEIKPEITGHGGEIYSSIPGGGYDHMSGTSMATPNMCGVVVLIKQYLKEKYPTYNPQQIQKLTYALLMSTATIANNEEGNPYTPRKQGAGLANLKASTTSNGYITVEGKDKPKLELGDDKNRTGNYEMTFTINNISNKAIEYTLDLDVMTESVSKSDSNYVAEKSYMLDNTFKAYVNGSEVTTKKVSVPANGSVTVTYKYSLTDEAKAYMDSSFPYGIYVEGYVKAIPTTEGEAQLNTPFLAFYGDWTEAPIFDKSYFDVETTAHNANIDDDDKVKADYWATRPYASYMYNYIVPLGTYIYDLDETKYTAIPGSIDHIAVGDTNGALEGIAVVYAGCLRAAKTMTYTITDSVTGEVIWTYVDYNCAKAFGNNGSAMPYYNYIRQTATELGLVNNRKYTFNMIGTIDYGDGGLSTNVRNSFGFDFTMDNEAPIIKDATYEVEYDESAKKNRYYVTLTCYDNHYVQAVTPVSFFSKDGTNTYTTLSNPVPVYSTKGEDSKVRIEITDYMDSINSNTLASNCLFFNIDDYALNANIFAVELPGTTDTLSFTEDGTQTGATMGTYRATVGEQVELYNYLTSASEEDKSYFKYLTWTSDDESVAVVSQGIAYAKKTGRCNITVTDRVTGQTTKIIFRVQAASDSALKINKAVSGVEGVAIKKISFDYFDTVFAYANSGDTSAIGTTGDRLFLTNVSSPAMYPGEQIQLHANFDPWYADSSNATWSSTNSKIVSVDQNGVVTALKEGSATISLTKNNSTLSATVKITVNSEFVIESRTLTAYKGLGGVVEIPDDKGILYIGAYAFSLYTTDRTVQNPDNDDDYNKTPSSNSTITKIIVPEGVEDIKKYAFYNLSALEEVVLPSSLKYVREYAFSTNTKNNVTSSLKTVNLNSVEVIGEGAFANCTKLESISLDKCYAIGKEAFMGCTSLTTVDISKVRNSGSGVFKNCTNLTSYTTDPNGQTRIGAQMFYNSGLTSVAVNSTQIPEEAFSNCKNLTTVVINGSVVTIGNNAFANNSNLTSITVNGTVEYLNDYAFANNAKLTSVVLPNSGVKIGSYVLANDPALTSITFQAKTSITSLKEGFLSGSNVSTFTVQEGSSYTVVDGILYADNEQTIVLVATKALTNTLFTVPNTVTSIKDGAFSSIDNLEEVVFNSNVQLGSYAFAEIDTLKKVTFASDMNIASYAFYGLANLYELGNLDMVSSIGSYAFAQSFTQNHIDITLGDVTVLDHAFANSGVNSITFVGASEIGEYVFQNAASLRTVTISGDGDVVIGAYAFDNAYNLNSFDFSTVTSIGDYAFRGCNYLTKAIMPKVETIGEGAFVNCRRLDTASAPKLVTLGAYAFGKSEDTKTAPIITEFVIADTVESIGAYAFYGSSIESITINSNIVTINPYTFASCANLTTVVLSSSVKTIDEYAFALSSKLSSINLENVETIGTGAFATTQALKTVNLNKVKTIGEGAFANSGLNCAIVAPCLEEIGAYAFQSTPITGLTALSLKVIREGSLYGTKISTFTLTNNISLIGETVFFDANNLTEINYLDSNNNVQTTGKVNEYAYVNNGVLYTYINGNSHKLRLLAVPNALNVEKLEVVEGTSYIEIFAGNANTHIKSIVLPDSLRTIGAYAFYKYSSLEEVEFKSVIAPKAEAYLLDTLYKTVTQNGSTTQVLLQQTDPGYEKIHKYYNLFSEDLYYANFIDLIGRNEGLKITLPSNAKLQGYDSIFFDVYFDMDNATISSYEAMDSYTVQYLEYVETIMNKSYISLDDSKLISNCTLAYSNMKSDLTKYGYTEAEIKEMENAYLKASADLRELKYRTASKEVKELQETINNLNTTFDISRLSELKSLAKKLDNLTSDNREILDLTNYNLLLESYNTYLSSLNNAISSAEAVSESSYNHGNAIAIALVSAITSLSVLGILLKKF